MYNKGLDPTKKGFTDYINGSNDWANIGKEIKYFTKLLDSEHEFERIDVKGYILTCMFKILVAVDEFDNQKTDRDGNLLRTEDPRTNIDHEVSKFLGEDLSKQALRLKTLQYSKEIIDAHGNEDTPYALSSVASVYGTRAYMQHLGLLSEEEAKPEKDPKKYYNKIETPMPDNIKRNISLAMEKFEQSAELGNVRSMGSVVTWAEKCGNSKLLDHLNQVWTFAAATAETPNPNSQIDYAKILEKEGRLKEAQAMLKNASKLGLEKAQLKLKDFHGRHPDLGDEKSSAEKLEDKKSFVQKLGIKKEDQTKSFVERMHSDKTKGKSLGGSNEL